MKYCIIIPVYKENLDCCELISLKRLYKILGNTKTDIYLVCPKKMNTEAYVNIYPTLKIKEFEQKWFKSTATYSQLLINYKFYNSFNKYDYMYIYQLDCYLVEDKLKQWCDMGYDYIGAPILSNDANWKTYDNNNNEDSKWIPQVGNGGFSLRKISTFKDITDPNGEFRTYYKLTDDILKNVVFEDKYFCNDIYNFYDLTKPTWIESLYFAIDMNADVIYNKLNFKSMPMCIHAWGKNIRYWKNVLEELKDNTEVIDYCEEVNKDFFKLYYDDNDSSYRENDDEKNQDEKSNE